MDVFKILFRENILGPDTGLPTKFRQDPLRIVDTLENSNVISTITVLFRLPLLHCTLVPIIV